jgi:branched-chain amino acid transport system substrate-binding protein
LKKIISGLLASAMAFAATSAMAQTKPLKLGAILDMSGLYADITGLGSETAAKMAARISAARCSGRKIEIVVPTISTRPIWPPTSPRHARQPGCRGDRRRCWLGDGAGCEEIARTRNKIIMFNGPGAVSLTNEACGPYIVHYTYDTYAQANVTGLATVKRGLNSWFFLTADYAFGQELERDTSNVVTKAGGKVSAMSSIRSTPRISRRSCCRRRAPRPR